jgi:hypothetical protein
MGGVSTPPEDEQGCVGAGCSEANGGGERGEAMKPGPRRLLEAVEGLGEATDMIAARSIDEAGRPVATYLLVENAVKESVLHVELVYGPATRARQSKHRADSRRLDNWREGFAKVDAGAMGQNRGRPTGPYSAPKTRRRSACA